jgi:hypothetical protein
MDWLSPVVSGAVGLGGLALAWRTLTGTREHEVATWYRERRADAYVELLEVAEDISHAVATAYPPTMRRVFAPVEERQTRARARVAAFGSPAVKAAVGLWLAAATEALRAAEVLNTPPEGIRLGEDAVDRYRDARNAERLARDALDRAVSDDLSP